MAKEFEKQVQQFHEQILELVKRYQFRDRNKNICCGLSVSQCYIMETLKQNGPLSMNNLAKNMLLSISTVTRVIQPLLKKGFLKREEDSEDRRIRLISLTEKGTQISKDSWKRVIESERIILNNFPEDNREMLIEFLKMLNLSVEQWQTNCNI